MSEKERFCKLLNEAIIDEDKAPKDYEELAEAFKKLGITDPIELGLTAIGLIAEQEQTHKRILEKIKQQQCPI